MRLCARNFRGCPWPWRLILMHVLWGLVTIVWRLLIVLWYWEIFLGYRALPPRRLRSILIRPLGCRMRLQVVECRGTRNPSGSVASLDIVMGNNRRFWRRRGPSLGFGS